MKALFSIVGLIVVLGIVGLLAKKQLGSAAAPPSREVPGSPANLSIPAGTPPQAVPQQFKSAVESTLQQPRSVDDSK